jgi:uncharacterized membrane protein YqjE
MESTGLMNSLKRLLDTVLGICQTRIALLSNEIEEERVRVGQMLLLGSAALVCFGLAIILLLVFIVVIFWEQHVLVLGGLTAIFFIAGFVLWNALQNALKEKSKLFSASLAELGHDRDQLAPTPKYE